MTIVYAFGSNGNGQLGIGHTDDVAIPTPCIGLPVDDPITKVTGGGNHAAALTQSGKMYMTGQWNAQQKTTSFFEPPVLQGRVWHDMACGWSFTILVERGTGQVFGLGTAKSGELGAVGSTGSSISTPSDDAAADLVHIHVDAPLQAVACGWRHVIGLANNGSVYGWGWNRHGQLGAVSSSSSSSSIRKPFIQPPLLIPCPKSMAQVACGHVFTIVMATDGTVYGFGSNKYGQLFTDNPDGYLAENATAIAAGWHHAAAATFVNNNKQLKLWGRDDHGQLAGQSIPAETFVCGSEHMLALYQGKVFSWGWNEHGNCATCKESVYEPHQVVLSDGQQATLIGAGCATSWIGVASSSSSS